MGAFEAALILFGLLFGLMFLRVPIAFALGLACVPLLVLEDRLSPMVLFNETAKAFSSFILLAIPFFLLAATLMTYGGVTDRLVVLSRALVGHLPGSLAQVNVVMSMFFAGVSGSATADAASQGKIFIPAQVKEGYALSFSVAVTATTSILAVIIPPSIMMIVWGGILSVSIGGLFLAGILPGVLVTLGLMLTVYFYARRGNYPTYPRPSLGEIAYAVILAVPALVTPFIIIGGKIWGWFTPTESAVVAVLYTLVISFLVYRHMGFRQLFVAFADTGRLASVTLFAVGTASAFGWLLAYFQVPNALLAEAMSWNMGLVATGFFVAAVFLVVGCFLDAVPAIIIVGTLLQPIAEQGGMHPIHFGLVGIISLALGLVTPPYGLCLMIACSIGDIRLTQVMKDIIIMLIPIFVVLGSIIVLPDLFLAPVSWFDPILFR